MAHGVDVIHPLQNLAHEQLVNGMTDLEIGIAEQTTKIVVHVGKDHEYVPSTTTIRGVFYTSEAGLQGGSLDSPRSTTISIISTMLV